MLLSLFLVSMLAEKCQSVWPDIWKTMYFVIAVFMACLENLACWHVDLHLIDSNNKKQFLINACFRPHFLFIFILVAFSVLLSLLFKLVCVFLKMKKNRKDKSRLEKCRQRKMLLHQAQCWTVLSASVQLILVALHFLVLYCLISCYFEVVPSSLSCLSSRSGSWRWLVC